MRVLVATPQKQLRIVVATELTTTAAAANAQQQRHYSKLQRSSSTWVNLSDSQKTLKNGALLLPSKRAATTHSGYFDNNLIGCLKKTLCICQMSISISTIRINLSPVICQVQFLSTTHLL
jgi:hypothetical protein